jgi:hypothetical protein
MPFDSLVAAKARFDKAIKLGRHFDGTLTLLPKRLKQSSSGKRRGTH